MNRTIIVSGSRTIQDYELVKGAIESSPWFGEIVHVHVGDARGVDTLTIRWCRENGITYTVFYADWDEWGRQAGPIRNQEMIDEGGEGVVLVWDGKSKGSASMKSLATKAKLPIHEVTI